MSNKANLFLLGMKQAFQLAVDPRGRIVVYDFGLRRFTTFTNGGETVATVGLHELGWRWITDFCIGVHGNVYIKSLAPNLQDLNAASRISISRIDLASLEETPVDSAYIEQTYGRSRKGNTLSISMPFHPQLLWGVAPSGNIIVCNSDDYVIKVYAPDLTLLRRRRFERKKPPVTAEDRKEYIASFEGEARALAEVAPFPSHKPFFYALHVDDMGFILFQREEASGAAARYDVFSPEGEFVREVILPDFSRSTVFSNGMIYTIGLYEEESLVVYRYGPAAK